MVRTPLARRIDAELLLNSAFCYLPDFDPQAAQSVVDYLTGENDEFGGTCAKGIIVNAMPTQVPAALDAQEMKLFELRIAEYYTLGFLEDADTGWNTHFVLGDTEKRAEERSLNGQFGPDR